MIDWYIILEYCGVNTPTYSLVNPSFPVKLQFVHFNDFWLKVKRLQLFARRALLSFNCSFWGLASNIDSSMGYQP